MSIPFAQIRFPEMYERVLVGPLFCPFAEALLDGLELRAGERIVVRTVRFEDGLLFVRMNAMALVGMSANAGEMAEAERHRLVDVIVGDSADVLTRHSDARGLRYELATNMTTASTGQN